MSRNCFSKAFKEQQLLIWTLIFVIIGVVLGVCLRSYDLSDDTILLISYPGELFLRCLKLMILPLIVTSLITSTSSLNIDMNGKLVTRTFSLFCISSSLSVVTGIVFALVICPGKMSVKESSNNLINISKNSSAVNLLDSLLDLGRNIVPDNLFQATFQSSQTIYVPISKNINSSDVTRQISYRSGTNTLGLVFFSALFGISIAMIGEKGKIVSEFFQATFAVTMNLVTKIILLTPIGVCSIITGKILEVSEMTVVLTKLGWFAFTVVIGLALYHLVTLHLMYFIVMRRNYFKIYCHFLNPMLTGAALTSTAATLPVTFQVMQEILKIDSRITKFVLPLGASSNTPGVGVMVTVSSIFIAQMNDVDLDIGQIITIAILAFTASLATSSVPSSSLMIIIMVLNTLNIPTENVMLLFAIDWFLDRCRTATNVLSDCYMTVMVEHLSKSNLPYLGVLLRPRHLSADTILLISFPGELFMRALKLIILPLIVTSLIAGTASLNVQMNGKIALRTFVLFCSTSLFSAIMGTCLVLLIRPGEISHSKEISNSTLAFQKNLKSNIKLLDSLLDLGRNIIPDNLLQAAFQSTQTTYINSNLNENSTQTIRQIGYRNGTNMLGLVFFSAIFGISIGMIGEKGKIISDFFQATFEVIMKLVTKIILLTPIGVCSIIAGKILEVSDVEQALTQLGWFIKNPFKFYWKLLHPMLISAACASTGAALPATFEVMDRDIKIDPRITKFILPIGANSNMDGSAIMISVSSIFIAQMSGINLDLGQILSVVILAFTSLAVSSVPSSALIAILMVLNSLNIPTSDMMLLFAIDWFVDRLRTTANMLSDCYIAAIVEHLSETELASIDQTESTKNVNIISDAEI
uniref:CSON008580 protein n=1 Tax=Culicoides sonorensis TaxID=179676 RepID=A0A336LZJ5_CULSO